MRTALAGAGAAGASDAGASQGAAQGDNGGSAWALVPVAADGDSTLQPGDKRLVVPLSAAEATIIGRSQHTQVRRALPLAQHATHEKRKTSLCVDAPCADR
jgi:hypothetical protein